MPRCCSIREGFNLQQQQRAMLWLFCDKAGLICGKFYRVLCCIMDVYYHLFNATIFPNNCSKGSVTRPVSAIISEATMQSLIGRLSWKYWHFQNRYRFLSSEFTGSAVSPALSLFVLCMPVSACTAVDLCLDSFFALKAERTSGPVNIKCTSNGDLCIRVSPIAWSDWET